MFSKNENDHKKHVDMILKRLDDHDLTLKECKCHWAQKKIDLLGYVVCEKGISAQPAKTEAISQLTPPKNVKELKRFLGMTGYYRSLIQNYSGLAVPLFALTNAKTRWKWSDEAQTAYERLRDALCSNKVMAFPQLNKPYILYTDASDLALGSILCQKDEQGIERPIQYISAKFNS
ncbi:MAG: hypothetical protein GY707_19595, partial [Desulfobacteraceae bacterium]|nr:hypothetical protein [Desulfobacteraceae bacterium]